MSFIFYFNCESTRILCYCCIYYSIIIPLVSPSLFPFPSSTGISGSGTTITVFGHFSCCLGMGMLCIQYLYQYLSYAGCDKFLSHIANCCCCCYYIYYSITIPLVGVNIYYYYYYCIPMNYSPYRVASDIYVFVPTLPIDFIEMWDDTVAVVFIILLLFPFCLLLLLLVLLLSVHVLVAVARCSVSVSVSVRRAFSYSCNTTMPTPYEHYRSIPLRYEMLLLLLYLLFPLFLLFLLLRPVHV